MNRLVALAVLGFFSTSHASAQAEAMPDENLRPIVESYVVEEGDTLAKLARRYLGPEALWNTNVAVNPDISDPDMIVPGQVINIITGYEVPAPVVVPEPVEVYQAIIEDIFNIVEKNVKRSDWRDAAEGDRLFPLDAVRTKANSAAVLQFDGASTVLISEYSQVFLRALEQRESGLSRSEIEIRSGETELRLERIDTPQQQIEINVAGTITLPARGADGSNSTRARKVGDDTSQVMVYDGSSAVESAGVSVDVATGMGTTAVAGQAPAAPERLLPAPDLHPLVGSIVAENIEFSWEPLDGAAGYRLDVCKDLHCTQPILNRRGITDSTVIVESLPTGISYWRVTGVSESGLDGFTSSSDELNIVAVPEKTEIDYFLLALVAMTIVLLLAMVVLFTYYSRTPSNTEATKTIRI